jgi:hypothetical protein
MKKAKRVIWLLILLANFQIKSQNKCATSLTLTENTGWRGVDSFDVSERWHFFNAGSTDYYV